MGWERRPTGSFFYLSRRDDRDGRVRKIYLGRGLAAKLVADQLAENRAARAAERASLEAEQLRLGPPEQALAELDVASDLMASAALLAAGYHRHDRGSWRKKRGQTRPQEE
jgi:hypothetical protein